MDYKVSIVVPSYKRDEKLFARAIGSLLNQTYSNIEIIVVDDNAKPELRKFRNALENYIRNLNSDKVVYVQNEKNLGGSLSRNAGIERSSGDYITFLDDDDQYLPEKVEKQLNFITEHNYDAIFGDLAIYNEDENLIDYRSHRDIKKFDKESLIKYHLTKQITGTPTFMVKKELLTSVGGFDDVKMGQEYFLMFKLIESGSKIGYAPWCDIMAYRTKAEAISTGANKITGEKALYEFKKSHFDKLSLWSRSYVRCRHYAVMSVAYKRNHIYTKMVGALIVSVLSNPLIVITEGLKYFKNLIVRS